MRETINDTAAEAANGDEAMGRSKNSDSDSTSTETVDEAGISEPAPADAVARGTVAKAMRQNAQ